MIYRFGDCELDDQRYELRRGGALVHLEPQVFEVLAYLARHRHRVVPKTELLDQIWGSRFVSESALTSRLKAARRAVGDSGREQRVIGTVHGRGHRFLAPVRETGATPAGVVDSRGRALSGSATLPPGGPNPGAGRYRPSRLRLRLWSGARSSWSGWASCTAWPSEGGGRSCS